MCVCVCARGMHKILQIFAFAGGQGGRGEGGGKLTQWRIDQACVALVGNLNSRQWGTPSFQESDW